MAIDTAGAKTWYVYMLCDPDTNEPFYVGKGSGDRMDIHESNHYRNHDTNRAKQACIKAIHAKGKSVAKRKMAEFDNELDAFVYEFATIAAYSVQLTNMSCISPTRKRANREETHEEAVVASLPVQEEEPIRVSWLEIGSILDLNDVSKLLSLKKDIVIQLIRAGKLAGFKLGGKWRFRRTTVEQYKSVAC